ncbi:MAG: restriction endonuclease subunit S [Nautiliaceae bacterium]
MGFKDMLKEYKKKFENLKSTKDRRSRKKYKELSKEEQEKIENKEFRKFVKEREREKFLYFLLTYNQKTLVINSPNKTNEIKKFLGYEWSSAKGNEGIKYISNVEIKEELDEDEKRTLQNIKSINNIQTPLYNPKNLDDENKLNVIIRNFLEDKEFRISEDLQKFVKVYNLTDMLDIKESEFNKVIRLKPKVVVKLSEKYQNIKLGNIVDTIGGLWEGKKPPFIKAKVLRNTNFGDTSNNIDFSDVKGLQVEEKQFRNRELKEGDIILEKSGGSSHQAVGRVMYFDLKEKGYTFSNFMVRLRLKNNRFKSKFLFLLLDYVYNQGFTFDMQTGMSNIKNLQMDDYLNIQIPLVERKIQENIVKECSEIDEKVEKLKEENVKLKREIEEIINNVKEKSVLLKDLVLFNPSKKEIANLDENLEVSFIPMEYVSENGYIKKQDIKKLKELKKGSYTYFRENDIIIAKITPSMENGKCAIARNLKNNIAFGSSEFHVFRVKDNDLDNGYLFYFLNREQIRKQAQQVMTGASGHKRVPINFYENLKIPLPPIEVQQEIVKQIEKLEKRIRANEEIINSAKTQKEEILRKYL